MKSENKQTLNSLHNAEQTPDTAISRRHFITIASATIAAVGLSAAFPRRAQASPSNTIAIIHTNDVHCSLSQDTEKGNIGYAGVAQLRNDAKTTYGQNNVALVDAGDYLQGLVAGSLTSGSAPVTAMNAAGYDCVTLGNHDFDYGIARLEELIASLNCGVTSCNYWKVGSSKPIYSSYIIKEYAGKKVAFLGITTPETLTKSNPLTFKNAEGKFVYNFKQDETGQELYDCVQAAVDAARNEGAQYVIALAHLGQGGITARWRSDTLVANTSGIDAVIDGHSHEKYLQTEVLNKLDQPVIITQAGTQLACLGRITIDTDTNQITAELLTEQVPQDATVENVVNQLEQQIAQEKNRQVGTSQYDLIAMTDEGVTKLARMNETNMGDFVTDALRERLGTQIALMNGGALRSNIAAGTITTGDLINLDPFLNRTAVIKISGQTILDALEMGARMYPEPLGGFLQVSGLTYEIRSDIASTVELTAEGEFVCVAGERRVRNVRVADEEINPESYYTVATIAYLAISCGDGYSMFKGAEYILEEGPVEHELLAAFIQNNLGGTVGSDYKDIYGQGRIVIKNGEDVINPQNGDEIPRTKDSFAAVSILAVGGIAALAATTATAAMEALDK